MNQAHLENGEYEQSVTHLERQIELNGVEAPDELQINTVSHNTTNTSADRPKPTCQHCKKANDHKNQFRLLKRQKEQSEVTQNIPGNKNSGAYYSIPNNNTNKNKNNNKYTDSEELKESQKLFIHPV